MRLWRSKHRDLRVAVVGYDLKFIRPLVAHLEEVSDISFSLVEFGSLHAFPEDDIAEAVGWADIVVNEFCAPTVNQVAELCQDDQPLIVRMHRFEFHRGFCDNLNTEAITKLVGVNDFYRDLMQERTGLGPSDVITIPNVVDTAAFDLPKASPAPKTIGFLGAASQRKRLDLALDVIEGVRIQDPEFVLSIKGALPEDLKWVMDDPEERAYVDGIADRLDTLTNNGGVTWEPAGNDVAEWFTGVGYILSTSDDESFHLSPVEGMASGTVPLVRNWPGADTVYDEVWRFDTPSEAAGRVLELSRDDESYASATAAARAAVAEIDLASVAQIWLALFDELDPR